MRAASLPHAARTWVLPCHGVALSGSYLGGVGNSGPGFLFRIENDTKSGIRLEEPVPSSADWYAHVGSRWLWRASAGRGGSLVNAENPHGPMFAYTPTAPPAHPRYLVVPAHSARQWQVSMRADPAIAYDPGCPMCSYTGEKDYQAVFAYAYLPNPGEHAPDLLSCGLRSAPVPMPPH